MSAAYYIKAVKRSDASTLRSVAKWASHMTFYVLIPVLGRDEAVHFCSRWCEDHHCPNYFGA